MPQVSTTTYRESIEQLTRRGKILLVYFFLISLAVHLISYINLSFIADHLTRDRDSKSESIKINMIDPRTMAEKNKEMSAEQRRQIVEVIQQQTERPDNPSYSSFQNHKTERETRVEITNIDKGKSAGPKGTAREVVRQQTPPPGQTAQKSTSTQMVKADGKVMIPEVANEGSRRSTLQKLLPTQQELMGLVDAGYQQHLNEKIALGTTVDLNTSEYRFIGYFSVMRKAIEMVWTYPADAARQGMQGVVAVEFVINRPGTVSRLHVIKSSGYKLLDDAIVQAIKMASPFSPLPDSYEQDMLKVTGSYQYILSSNMQGAH